MKIIVTHISPDTDAMTSIWLIHKFMPGFKHAVVKFVPAGQTLNNKPADDDPDIVHVDTGLGRFDHHQRHDEQCAASKVLKYLRSESLLKKQFISPLNRLVDVVCQTDHFQEVFFDNADHDINNFSLMSIIDGLKVKYQDDHQLVATTETLLDAVLQTFFSKIQAEKDIQKGLTFSTVWGKTLAILSDNEESIRHAQKNGYSVVIRKSPTKKIVRIKSLPLKKIDLHPLYKKLKEKDPQATWFFHVSRHMILNGSSKNPDVVPSKLTLPQIVKIAKSI